MNIINFGSLNNDYVYKVEMFARPGETIVSRNMEVFPGGKGLNQSLAIARAGQSVGHAGYYGNGGEILRDLLLREGVDCTFLKKCDSYQGQAVIQVDDTGQNCIVVYGGSNNRMDREFVDRILSRCGGDTIVVVQNEVSCVDYIIQRAAGLGMRVIFNPSPMTENIKDIDLGQAAWLLLNEVEGAQITGKQEHRDILEEIKQRCPGTGVVLTLGAEGAYCAYSGQVIYHKAYKVPVVDTTAAGDTFTGYFIAGLAAGRDLEEVMQTASVAASICVSKAGASPSIPRIDEVSHALDQYRGIVSRTLST